MKKIRKVLFFISLFVMPFLSYGDPPDPDAPPVPPGCPTPSSPPVGAGVEDGIYLLITFSALYGSYAIYRNRKKVQVLKRT